MIWKKNVSWTRKWWYFININCTDNLCRFFFPIKWIRRFYKSRFGIFIFLNSCKIPFPKCRICVWCRSFDFSLLPGPQFWKMAGSAASDLQAWFWNDDYWLPENVTWSDLESSEQAMYVKSTDLWYPIPAAFILIGLRYILERYIILSLIQWLLNFKLFINWHNCTSWYNTP